MQLPAKAAVAVEYFYPSCSHPDSSPEKRYERGRPRENFRSSSREGGLVSCSCSYSLVYVVGQGRRFVQTECAQALMKMRLPNSRRNFCVWKTKTIRTSSAFCFNDPKRKLRQLCFHISGPERRKIEIHHALRF